MNSITNKIEDESIDHKEVRALITKLASLVPPDDPVGPVVNACLDTMELMMARIQRLELKLNIRTAERDACRLKLISKK